MNCTKPTPSIKFEPLIERYGDFWNTVNFEDIETVLHPGFELRITPKFEAERGIQAFKESITKWREA
jgi:hypothetical protein